jgi:CheY-like chemotaxis protein
MTNHVTGNRNNLLQVLVVDDDPLQLEIISDLLRDLGVGIVTSAKSGAEAVRCIAGARSPFQLMVSDLQMPGMDGFEFMEAAAQGGFKGSLIIASGQSSDVMHSASLVARLRRFNLLGTLPKPVDPAALKDLLSKLP